MYDGGLYWVSDLVITWGVGDIPHWTICSCWIFAVAFSGNGEQNHQEILLAINRHRHSRRRVGHWIDVFDIKKRTVFTVRFLNLVIIIPPKWLRMYLRFQIQLEFEPGFL